MRGIQQTIYMNASCAEQWQGRLQSQMSARRPVSTTVWRCYTLFLPYVLSYFLVDPFTKPYTSHIHSEQPSENWFYTVRSRLVYTWNTVKSKEYNIEYYPYRYTRCMFYPYYTEYPRCKLRKYDGLLRGNMHLMTTVVVIKW